MRSALRALLRFKYTFVALALLGIVAAGMWYVPQNIKHLRTTVRTTGAAAATVAPTPTPDPLAPPAAPGAWNPTFVESFNATRLDTSRWNTCFWWAPNAPLGCDGSSANGELQRYLPQNVTVENGALDIVARKEQLTTDARTYGYTSGLITTDGKFAFRYGYVEARIWITKNKGIWPAVWMLPVDHSNTNEVDIAEILGDRPDELNTALHFLVDGAHQSVGGIYQGADLSAGYHVVAVDWEPQRITWYEDGKPVYTISDQSMIPHKDMYLLLNAAVGGYWSGNPNTSTVFPSDFKVDWVQVWQTAASSSG